MMMDPCGHVWQGPRPQLVDWVAVSVRKLNHNEIETR